MVSLSFQDLRADLAGQPILHGVSAAMQGGELVGIIGPNGAGKSTLLRALLGLIPYQGQVHLNGQDIRSFNAKDRAKQIAYLPQGQTVHWPLLVERLVGLGRLPHLGPLSRIAAADRDAIEQAMQRTHVTHLKDRDATSLSGGERARVMLARALAVEAEALLADEPLANLDPAHQLDVMELLRAEAQNGALVITVLHDLPLAARYCDRLILLHHGRIAADGAPQQILTPDLLRAVYELEAEIDFSGKYPSIQPIGRPAEQSLVAPKPSAP